MWIFVSMFAFLITALTAIAWYARRRGLHDVKRRRSKRTDLYDNSLIR